jgi:GNAT superfamily N-acetyltransferase
MTPQPETSPTPPVVEVLESLSAADAEDFARLLPQLSSTPRTAEEVDLYLQRALNSPTTRVVVIRDAEGRIQATATGNLVPIPTGYKPWIDDVVTDRDHRGQGWGNILTESLEDWVRDMGGPYVNLTSQPFRNAAGNLYAKRGYRERDTRVYRLQLGATATGAVLEQ